MIIRVESSTKVKKVVIALPLSGLLPISIALKVSLRSLSNSLLLLALNLVIYYRYALLKRFSKLGALILNLVNLLRFLD